MKVLNLRCSNGHGFEGWFASEEAFADQSQRGLIECPACADHAVTRLPSAPRLNLSGARALQSSAPTAPATTPSATVPVAAPGPDMQALWLHAVRHVLAHTEDVGRAFPEQARRMHYGEIEQRGIRGQATPQEREALAEEGIEVMPLPIPQGLDGPTH